MTFYRNKDVIATVLRRFSDWMKAIEMIEMSSPPKRSGERGSACSS